MKNYILITFLFLGCVFGNTINNVSSILLLKNSSKHLSDWRYSIDIHMGYSIGYNQVDGFNYSINLAPGVSLTKKNNMGEIIGSKGINSYFKFSSKNYFNPLNLNRLNAFWIWGTTNIIYPYIGIGTEYVNNNGYYWGIETYYILPTLKFGKYF